MREYIGYIIVLMLLVTSEMQSQSTFASRLIDIEKELTERSQTNIPGLNEKVRFSVVEATLQELIRGVAETHQLNVSVSPQIQVIVSNNFTDVLVKDLLLFLCKEYRLDISFVSNIISFEKYVDAPIVKEETRKLPQIRYDVKTDQLSIDLDRDSLSVFVRELCRISKRNVLIGAGVKERIVNGSVLNVRFWDGLDKLAMVNGLRLDSDSLKLFYVLNEINSELDDKSKSVAKNGTNGNRIKKSDGEENLIVTKDNVGKLSVDAISVDISDIISEAAATSMHDYIFFTRPEGKATLRVRNVDFDELLKLLLKGTEHTYALQDGIYVVGNRMEEGFRKTQLVKFHFRPIWELEKMIPESISKNIQILPFEDLNAMILCGSSNRVLEVESFLKQLDQPVPNILIDVMVIELRKSHSVQTGLRFFSSDSTVNTSGKIFPGVDMSIGSKSVNSALNRLESVTSVNLGRVKPNFYVKLQALEQNGDIKIKSTPKLATLNGHEAMLTIGKSVYYLEKTQNVTGGVNPIITTTPRFNKVDANLSIKIKPMVSGDENVTLNIEAEFSDFIAPEITDAPPGNATRKFMSQIKVLNDEVVLLGGLEEATRESSGSGLPILSRIPILKWIFSTRSRSVSNNKLLVLIKPQIVY